MKTKNVFFILLLLVLFASTLTAQKTYKYETAPNDPLKVRIYTLDNGLKVYITVYKDAPRIQTAIAVRTGSKNDPHDNTGLSHYLEHIMFKGTDEYGTKDYQKEKPLLDQIENKFEVYKKTNDSLERKKIYHEIDSLSGIAATYAIANEYDKLLAVIGAKGTNAFTSFEETVYINDIPSNRFSQWLQIEKERFSDPVFRIFHTELETVYEEKNMSMDSDNDKVFDSLFSGLFPTHTYGTQTTLGTAEHLKNPSIKSIKNYYATRYVPNNMAILLSGDIDPDLAVRKIDETFGKLASRPVEKFNPPVEAPFTKPVVKEVIGPDAESVTIGYRMGGAGTKDADLVTLLNMILSNSTAGLMDLNLNQAQKVLESYAFSYVLTDYSVNIFGGKAKEGQSLEEVRDLMLSQVEMVKKGEFPEWLLPAIINNLKIDEIRQSESNAGRVFSMLDGFIEEIPRAEVVNTIDRLSKITRDDIIEFANKTYKDNYVIVYKRTGKAEETSKIVKPQITAVTMNRDDESDFYKKIVAEPAPDIQPVFLDYEKDVTKFSIKDNIQLLYNENTENQTFRLYYYFNMGTDNVKSIGIALEYLKYLGTSEYSPKEVQEEFYKIGCSFSVYNSENDLWVSLSGLGENMGKGISMFEHLLSDCQPDQPALENLVSDIGKRRADEKLNKGSILWNAMYNYGVFGRRSPFTNILSENELKELKPGDLIWLIKGLNGFDHKILYYGPGKVDALNVLLNREHKVPVTMKPVPAALKFEQLENNETKVYTVDYDMKQVEIVMLSKSERYNKEVVPIVRLFNEYFGGSMASIVFQEIRESKGLAYSAYAGYSLPSKPEYNSLLFSYLGTQADKLPEAMKSMMGIFNDMPESEKAMNSSKEAITNRIRTERITKANILFNYINAQRFGLTYDIRRDVYEKVPSMTFTDLKKFQTQFIKDKNFNIMVLGNRNDLDVETLENYGKVTPLTLQDIFGY